MKNNKVGFDQKQGMTNPFLLETKWDYVIVCILSLLFIPGLLYPLIVGITRYSAYENAKAMKGK